MAEAARALGRTGQTAFEYRLISPLFDHQGMVVRAVADHDSTATSVRDVYGRQTATATLRRLTQ